MATSQNAEIEVAQAGKTKTKTLIDGAYKNFTVAVKKVETTCGEMKRLSSEPQYKKDEPDASLNLDKDAMQIGRRVFFAIVMAQRYYMEYKVVFEVEREGRNYPDAMKFLEDHVIDMHPCSSFAILKILVLLSKEAYGRGMCMTQICNVISCLAERAWRLFYLQIAEVGSAERLTCRSARALCGRMSDSAGIGS
ncbi:uncharacterized protein BXIN_2098 [Babesia sp. Xinjiang]|uniref:uncharacterized protein n=1 Tax=Babesia sp. Xinjiang TaxID=462227 RepID=UPI000A24CDF9|nr:uncharacterized protein BXIN_2098 [Babesia sp. Xinjiang]ORM40460.1 hypothetical protein BXIN_2098 [Babesia sp. Xinjiang]